MSGALLLIENLIEKTTSSFMKLYNGNVVVVGVSVPSEASFMQQHQQHLKPIIKVLEQNHVMLLDLDNTGSEIHLMDKLVRNSEMEIYWYPARPHCEVSYTSSPNTPTFADQYSCHRSCFFPNLCDACGLVVGLSNFCEMLFKWGGNSTIWGRKQKNGEICDNFGHFPQI